MSFLLRKLLLCANTKKTDHLTFVTHDQHMKLIHKSLSNKNEHISPDSLEKCL